MSSPPDIDPYAELGLTKDATNAEIRASYRKRVLKCHPDKIQDATLRNAAQNEFQCVQQAYELLSDESRRARYDAKVKLAELKRELDQRRRTEPSYGRGSQEMRNGHVVEERVPFDTFFEEGRYQEEPRSFSRKADDFGKRPKAKEEKRRTRAPSTSERTTAKEYRESTKASQYEQSRRRGKERRGQRSEKFDSYAGPYVVSEAEASDTSDDEPYYVRRPSSRRPRESRESRSRPTEPSSRFRDIYEEDKYSYRYEGDLKQAEAHIQRSKYDNYQSRTSPHRSRGYESPEPDTSASRRSARSSRTTRTSSRNNSYEDLEPRYERSERSERSERPERPKMPTAATMPGLKTSLRPGFFGGRSATATGFTRSKTSSRENTLGRMVEEVDPPRSSKYDSGYSSPNTPELPPKSGSPKVTARYKIDPEPTIIEPISSKSSRYRTVSAERERDRPSRMSPPKRASTVQSYADEPPRIEVRSVRPSRPHGEPEFADIRAENIKFARVIRPSDASISPGRTHWSNPAHVRQRRTAPVS